MGDTGVAWRYSTETSDVQPNFDHHVESTAINNLNHGRITTTNKLPLNKAVFDEDADVSRRVTRV